MEIIRLDDLREDYARLCSIVLKEGEKIDPRGAATYELTNVALEFAHPYCCTFPNGIGRKVSPKILAAELLQWFAGVSDLAQLKSVSNGLFSKYSDDGTRLYGAYGPRAYRGLSRAVHKLAGDMYSRQAVVSIWSNAESEATLDLPCTLSWTFQIRNDKLNMTTVMRSNDVWTGVAYDIPTMARIQTAVAAALQVEPGTYTHIAHSLHIYETDAEKSTELHDIPRKAKRPEEPPFFDQVELRGTPLSAWHMLTSYAHAAMQGEDLDAIVLPDEFLWYAKQLEGTARYSHFCGQCRYWLPQPELICHASL